TSPRTLEQAILVARELDILYLWIDSICIDQDDRVAKSEQISIMDRIYEGAAVTIVALDGENADSGLPGVTDDPPRMVQEYINPNNEVQSSILLSRCPSFQAQLDNSVWMKRGWTYQEGMLSSCCLFFT
ncbi:heterokaryon incompatibility, partial [Amniculicola lignicola CBS 123094]